MKKYLPIFISLFLLLQPFAVKAQSDLPPEAAAYNPAAGVTGDEQKYCVTGCPLYFSGRAVGYYPRYIYKTTDRPWESLTPYPEAD